MGLGFQPINLTFKFVGLDLQAQYINLNLRGLGFKPGNLNFKIVGVYIYFSVVLEKWYEFVILCDYVR